MYKWKMINHIRNGVVLTKKKYPSILLEGYFFFVIFLHDIIREEELHILHTMIRDEEDRIGEGI